MTCKYFTEEGLCEVSGRCYFVVWFQPEGVANIEDSPDLCHISRQYRTLGTFTGELDKCPIKATSDKIRSECSQYYEE